MKKFIMALAAVLFILPAAVFAEEAAEPTPAPESATVTLDQAKEYAKQHDLDLKAAQDNITKCKYAIYQEKQTKKNYEKNPEVSSVGQYLYLNGYMLRTAEMQMRMAERAVVQKEYILNMNVEKSFYGYLNENNKYDLAQKSLENAKQQRDEAKVKLDQGSIAQLEYQSYELAVSGAQMKFNNALRSRDYALESLKNTMTFPANGTLRVTGEFTTYPMDDMPLDEALERNANNIDMVNLKESFENEADKFDAYSRFYFPNSFDFQQQKAVYAAAESNYQKSVNAKRLEVINTYNTMVSAYENLDYMQQSVALQEQQLKASKLRYEMGMVTTSDYIKETISFDDLKNSYSDAELNARLASLNYHATYSYENPITKEAENAE